MYQMLLDNDLIVDNFAGGGGASEGFEMALGRPVSIAINHDPEAVGMHTINHPVTHHECENIWDINPRKLAAGRRVRAAWFSPDCTHFSKAKGGKPVKKNIRGLAWVVLKWASLTQEEGKPDVIFLENVEEFMTWGPLVNNYPDPARKGETYRAFISALKRQGYEVEVKILKASDYDCPTIRKRLFMVARCDGQPIVWPEKTHGDPRVPGFEKSGLKPWRTAAECIDWSIRCPSIFERPRPLAENTLRRIGKGMKKFVINSSTPYIVGVGGRMGQSAPRSTDAPFQTITAKADSAIIVPYLTEHANASNQRVLPVDEPMRTICAQVKGGHFAVCEGFLVGAGGPAYSGKPTDIDKPFGTIMKENHKQLCTAFLVKHFGGMVGVEVDTPLPTITTRGTQNQLVTSHVMKMRGTNLGHPVDEPLHTVTSSGCHHFQINAFLLKYFGTDQDPRLDEPMHTITTKDRFAMVEAASDITGNLTEEQRYNAWWIMRYLEQYGAVPVIEQLGVPRPSFFMLGDYIMYDIGMRMLMPRELYRAQSFPDSYIIDRIVDKNGHIKPLNKTAQVRMCGNSVPPKMAKALVSANVKRSVMEDYHDVGRTLHTASRM